MDERLLRRLRSIGVRYRRIRMWKALAVKELRETLWMAVVALVVHLLLMSPRMGTSLLPWASRESREIPFVGPTFLTYFVVISACLAIGLGLSFGINPLNLSLRLPGVGTLKP